MQNDVVASVNRGDDANATRTPIAILVSRLPHDETAVPKYDAGCIDDIAYSRIGANEGFDPGLLDVGQAHVGTGRLLGRDESAVRIVGSNHGDAA